MKLNTVLILATLLMSSAQAATEVKAGSSSVVESAHRSGFGLGLASLSAGPVSFGALTAWIPIKNTMGIQAYLGIPTTAGNFNFLAGGAFKASIAGTSMNGFHIGGNALLGAIAGSFAGAFGGLIGAHFSLTNSMLLAVDGGPQILVGGGSASFSLAAISDILGASLIYFF